MGQSKGGSLGRFGEVTMTRLTPKIVVARNVVHWQVSRMFRKDAVASCKRINIVPGGTDRQAMDSLLEAVHIV